MINVIAVLTAKPGKLNELLLAFKGNVPHVLAEDGCLEYSAVIDLQDGPSFQTLIGPETFFVIEKWRDLPALKAHAKAPHMASYAAATKDLLASRTIHVLHNV